MVAGMSGTSITAQGDEHSGLKERTALATRTAQVVLKCAQNLCEPVNKAKTLVCTEAARISIMPRSYVVPRSYATNPLCNQEVCAQVLCNECQLDIGPGQVDIGPGHESICGIGPGRNIGPGLDPHSRRNVHPVLT